jgi:hypothetical protein
MVELWRSTFLRGRADLVSVSNNIIVVIIIFLELLDCTNYVIKRRVQYCNLSVNTVISAPFVF